RRGRAPAARSRDARLARAFGALEGRFRDARRGTGRLDPRRPGADGVRLGRPRPLAPRTRRPDRELAAALPARRRGHDRSAKQRRRRFDLGQRRRARTRLRPRQLPVRALPPRRDARGGIGIGAQPGPCARAGARRAHRARPESRRRDRRNAAFPVDRIRKGSGVMELLLVEDDERVRRFVLRGLEAEGYSVTAAEDGIDGLQRAQAESYDVLILDVMLPGLSGREVCRQLRQAEVPTPILMLTALDHTGDKVECLRGGADDYLTKPFDFEELLARLEALGRRARGFSNEPPAVVEIGNVRVDRQSMQAFLDGDPVELTAKEYQLLELLLSSPGKVFSRTRILNKVWGYDSDPLTNVVDVYIRRLRGKMHWDRDTGWIRTIRSYGYRLDPTV